MTNVIKILKDRDVFFSSEYPIFQASISGEQSINSPGGVITEHIIPHNLNFHPICIVYTIARIDGEDRAIECPYPAFVGGGVPFYDYRIDSKNLILIVNTSFSGTTTGRFKYFIIPREIKLV